jgi:condensin-2 complex subunit G2
MIHDKTEKVRVAMVQLLHSVKRVKAIRFFEVVPVEHLLVRMTIDSRAVNKSICALLLNSFFPYNSSPSTQVHFHFPWIEFQQFKL